MSLHLTVVYFHYLDLIVVYGLVTVDVLVTTCVFWDLFYSCAFGFTVV